MEAKPRKYACAVLGFRTDRAYDVSREKCRSDGWLCPTEEVPEIVVFFVVHGWAINPGSARKLRPL